MKKQDDWHWQLENSIRTAEQLEEYIELSGTEREQILAASRRFTWAITPYYAALMDPDDPLCPLRRQAVPDAEELYDPLGVPDPLDEGKHQPVELIIRVYPDRVAFCVGNRCPVYCRHCLRKETMVGQEDVELPEAKIQKGIDYIREHEEIRDVLLTGGDPLLMEDDRLEGLLQRLHRIPHVEVIRIGSRTPCTLPQRITPELCTMLAKYHPLYLNTQFNHPAEITAEAETACARLAGAGIPLGNQSVLLKGINDDAQVMRELCRELMRLRVRPYYLYQCQVLSGTRHFRTTIERGREIMAKLQGYISGLAVPKYLIDTPYGKVPLSPNYVEGRRGDDVVVRSWDGKEWKEPNPPEEGEIPHVTDAPHRSCLQNCESGCACGD